MIDNVGPEINRGAESSSSFKFHSLFMYRSMTVEIHKVSKMA